MDPTLWGFEMEWVFLIERGRFHRDESNGISLVENGWGIYSKFLKIRIFVFVVFVCFFLRGFLEEKQVSSFFYWIGGFDRVLNGESNGIIFIDKEFGIIPSFWKFTILFLFFHQVLLMFFMGFSFEIRTNTLWCTTRWPTKIKKWNGVGVFHIIR